MRRVYGTIALCTIVFAVINSGDRNPLQWPAAFICLAALFLYFTAALWVWSVQHRR